MWRAILIPVIIGLFNRGSSNNSILIEGWRPVPKESWITFLAPFQDDEFIIFSNSLPQGRVHVYSTIQDRTLTLNTIQERVWNGNINRKGALILVHNRGLLSICQLDIREAELRLATHERFPTGQRHIDQAAWIFGHSEQVFATHSRDTLALWDASRGGKVPLRTLVSGELVRELAVPQTDPHIIACALERELSLYDIRSGQKTLTLPSRTHLIRWNPFIPYWLASAPDDSGAGRGIDIHDIRYQRQDPLVALPAHFTSDICWSNANCELLLSSGSGRRISLWSIRQEGGSGLGSLDNPSCEKCNEEITGLQPSVRYPNLFFGASLLGDLMKVRIDQDYVKSLAPMYTRRSNHPRQDHRLEDIERSLYCRDFDAVFKDLLEFASSTSPSQFESLQRLSNQTLPMLPINAESWNIGCLDEKEHPTAFWNDVAKYSQGIPPSFYLRISEQPDAIEEVRFKMKVLEAIRHRDGALLAKLTNKIMDMLATDTSFFGHPTLVSITGVLLSDDRLTGLRFGRQVLELIIANCGGGYNNCALSSAISGDACALCHLLLFPTIFDVESVLIIPSSRNASPIRPLSGDRLEQKSPMAIVDEDTNVKNAAQPNIDQRTRVIVCPRPSDRQQRQTTSPKQTSGRELLGLRKFIRQTERARAMVDLEIALEEASDDRDKCNKVLKGLQDGLEGRTAAARTVFRYLEYLRGESQLEAYLTTLIPYCQAPHTDFCYALLEYVDKHVLPSLKYTLSQAIDTHRPSLVLRALILIVLLVDGRRPLPDDLELFLADRLRRLLRALQGEDYSRMPGYGRLTKMVMSIAGEDLINNGEIWKQIGLLRDHLRSVN